MKTINVMIKMQRNMFSLQMLHFSSRPMASEVLTAYLMQCNEPPWTSYFVKYSSVKDDQFGMSNFNWKVGSSNYQILRTGCFPYIKYHCSKKSKEDLEVSDKFMRAIKVVNLVLEPLQLLGACKRDPVHRVFSGYTSRPAGVPYTSTLLPRAKWDSAESISPRQKKGIPCLLYGLAATQLIKHTEVVHTTKGAVTIYFLLPEHKGSRY